MTRRAGAAREIVKCWKTARAVTPRWCCWRFGLVSRLDKLTASLRNDVARLCEPWRLFCAVGACPLSSQTRQQHQTRRQTIGDNCSTSSRAFTPSSAAGGIGPCLSTGEPDVAAAIKRSTLASPRAPRSTLALPRASAFHTRVAPRPAESSYVISQRGCEFIQSRHQPDAPARGNSSNGFPTKECDVKSMQLLSLARAGVVWVVAGIDAMSILARRRLLERVNEMRRGNGTLDAAATSGSPVLQHGPLPPAAEGCSGNVWFTRAPARAFAACGGRRA
jgi:hypothetical protein